MSNEDETETPIDLKKVNIIFDKYKISIKIVAIFCILMAFFLLSYGKYHEGRFDECLEHQGFYIAKESYDGLYPDKGDFTCVDNETLLNEGYIIDYELKVLRSKPINILEKGIWNLP
jgi:hypothetical protein